MKRPIVFAVAMIFLASCSSETVDENQSAQSTKADAWTMDFSAAKELAAAQGKDLFIEFTGSDWCPPCKQFDREVLSKQEFLNTAPEHFVLVKLDFPDDESLVPAEIREQNDALYEIYHVASVPTVVLANAAGVPYAVHEYVDIGVGAYLEKLDELRASRAHRDAAFEAAESLEGVEKAKAIYAALNLMGLQHDILTDFYGDKLEAIMAHDPGDETGLARKTATQKRLNEFVVEINSFAERGDFESVLPMFDDILKFDGFEPEDRQQIVLMRAMSLGQLYRFDEAILAVDEAAAIAPDSEVAEHLDALKEDFINARDALAEEE